MVLFAPEMEQQQRSLVVTAAVGLIILAIIIGSVYYLVRFIQGRTRTASNNPSPSVSASVSPASEVSEGAQDNPPNTKVHNAGNFQVVYPKDWGLLTCTNSANFELDPKNGADSKIACDRAVKSITFVLDNNTGCPAEAANIGQVKVTKSRESEGNYTRYQWCTQTQPILNITHRVSNSGETATSKEDYSKQIEEIISRLSFVHGS